MGNHIKDDGKEDGHIFVLRYNDVLKRFCFFKKKGTAGFTSKSTTAAAATRITREWR